MRWAVFAVFAVVSLVLDLGLGEVLRIEKLGQIRPGFCAILAVFVALSASRTPALWACLVLGLLLDIASPVSAGGNTLVYLVGPHALGFAAAGWLVIRGRTMVFRRRALTIGVMTVIFVLAAQAVVVGILALRAASWYPGGPVSWTETGIGIEILRAIGAAVYSGLVAVPAGWVLVRSMALWGFGPVRTPMAHHAPAIGRR